jgi:hypothetical protein
MQNEQRFSYGPPLSVERQPQQPPQLLSGFVPVVLSEPRSSSSSSNFEQVSELFPEADVMKKKGGRVGALIARHRKLAIGGALILMALGVVPVLYVIWNFLVISFRTVAPGINYLRDPSAVTLANGIVVHDVHQPLLPLQTSSQASMVMSEVRAMRQERRVLTPELISKGYLQWRVASGQPMHNFTLDKTAETVAKAVKTEDCSCPCVCYIYMGISENIVLLRTNNEVLYEPSVISEVRRATNSTQTTECSGNAVALVRKTLSTQELATVSAAQKQSVAESGSVRYITNRGALKNKNFKQPELDCIKECIAFF